MAGATTNLRLPSQAQRTAPRPVLISRLVMGRRLSWLEWLVTYQDSIAANGHPPQY